MSEITESMRPLKEEEESEGKEGFCRPVVLKEAASAKCVC